MSRKTVGTIIFISIVLAVAGLFTNILLPVGAVGLLVAGVVVLCRFEVATYVLGLYVILDYGFRMINPTLGSIWDEAVMILLYMLWILKWFISRNERDLKWSPMDLSIIFYIGINIAAFVANPYEPAICIDGMRANIQFIFFFFVVFQLLKSKEASRHIYVVLSFVATLIALHGIYQYIIKVPLPPGWVDSVETGVQTRVYSIIGSPNILGSFNTLMIPLMVSLGVGDKKILRKLMFFGMAGLSTLCLVFTLSRGAWMGFAAAAGVYILLKDKRLIVPAIALGILALVFVPAIGNRVAYMLSDEYIQSSLRGGRLVRWIAGIAMIEENLFWGVGLGHFGGAVAVNHLVEGTFYMDNYFLKTAVEMGLIGLTGFVVLMYQVIIWCYRSIKQCVDPYQRELMCGGFAGLFGVIVHNFVENVFEVPMMATYFWVIVAVMMHMAYLNKKEAPAQ